MINWIFILVALVLISVLLFFLGGRSYDYDILFYTAGVLTAVFALCVLGAIIFTPLSISSQTTIFESQSKYLAAHTPKNVIEDAAITSKKIELNDWLYSAKWAKNKFGTWSFYPESIFDLEPIQ